MSPRVRALIGTLVFIVIVPTTVVGWVPYTLSGWRLQEPLLGISTGRVAGGILGVAGLAVLLECFARFALQGLGTPAPLAPPARLVVSGSYRYVRNPMYIAVVAIIAGQGLFSAALPS